MHDYGKSPASCANTYTPTHTQVSLHLNCFCVIFVSVLYTNVYVVAVSGEHNILYVEEMFVIIFAVSRSYRYKERGLSWITVYKFPNKNYVNVAASVRFWTAILLYFSFIIRTFYDQSIHTSFIWRLGTSLCTIAQRMGEERLVQRSSGSEYVCSGQLHDFNAVCLLL